MLLPQTYTRRLGLARHLTGRFTSSALLAGVAGYGKMWIKTEILGYMLLIIIVLKLSCHFFGNGEKNHQAVLCMVKTQKRSHKASRPAAVTPASLAARCDACRWARLC